MNTASRLANKNLISRSFVFSLLLTKTQLAASILLLSILTSSISVIYISNACRSLHAVLHQKQVEKDNLFSDHNKLLLEKSTFIVSHRVQKIAEKELNMQVPVLNNVKIIHMDNKS